MAIDSEYRRFSLRERAFPLTTFGSTYSVDGRKCRYTWSLSSTGSSKELARGMFDMLALAAFLHDQLSIWIRTSRRGLVILGRSNRKWLRNRRYGMGLIDSKTGKPDQNSHKPDQYPPMKSSGNRRMWKKFPAKEIIRAFNDYSCGLETGALASPWYRTFQLLTIRISSMSL